VRVAVLKCRFSESGRTGEAWLRYEQDEGRFRPVVMEKTSDVDKA
jgi:hypothetical protein